MWDIFTKKSRVESLIHSCEVVSFTFNPVNPKQLVSATLNGDLNLWDVQESELIAVLEARRDLWGGRLNADFTTAANSTKNKHFTALAYSPTGEFLIAGGNSRFLCVFDMTHRLLLHKISITTNRSIEGVLHFLNSKNAINEEEQAYLSDLSNDDDTQALKGPKRAAGEKIKRKAQLAINISNICFNPDGSSFAIACTEGV